MIQLISVIPRAVLGLSLTAAIWLYDCSKLLYRRHRRWIWRAIGVVIVLLLLRMVSPGSQPLLSVISLAPAVTMGQFLGMIGAGWLFLAFAAFIWVLFMFMRALVAQSGSMHPATTMVAAGAVSPLDRIRNQTGYVYETDEAAQAEIEQLEEMRNANLIGEDEYNDLLNQIKKQSEKPRGKGVEA